jgi:hypothetical protein
MNFKEALYESAPATGSKCRLVPIFSSQSARDLGKTVENSNTSQPQFVIHGGIAANDGSGSNIIRNAALSRRNSTVADFAMSRYADLPR